ncbi:MAG TPA: hypothetical protein VF533_02695 [Solirubrobacteraceae bacterium]
MIEILEAEPFSREELLGSVRRTQLVGLEGASVYERASLSLEAATDPESLAPAQRYVLRPNVRTILSLRDALLAGHGIDVLALDGGVRVRTAAAPDEVIPVIPPIVEESHEPGGRTVLLISDGIHRVQAARVLGLPISVVAVRGVPEEYPYYAHALAGGWAEVLELDELPDEFEKKSYRVPTNYRALFRRYNDVFPGVQKDRKRSNPRHLRA